jgi:hypothetical protein
MNAMMIKSFFFFIQIKDYARKILLLLLTKINNSRIGQFNNHAAPVIESI